MNPVALAARDCAKTFVRLARESKAEGNATETARLIRNARLYWRWYIEGVFQ